MSTAQVLISCMHSDIHILEKLNLHHDVVVINQCDVKAEKVSKFDNHIIFIDTPTRGLSVSRNLAIKYADSEICVLSDDDEFFEPGIQEKIRDVYTSYPQADIIIFKIKDRKSKLGDYPHKLRYFDLFKVSSWQISFRRMNIIKSKLYFDVLLGSGTGNGAGEENKFLIDAYNAGLSIFYYPLEISSLHETGSQWFDGCNADFFYNRGATTRYILGLPLSIIYAFYYVLTHRWKYKSDISMFGALFHTLRGIYKNTISKEKNKIHD